MLDGPVALDRDPAHAAPVATTYWGTRSELVEVLALAAAGRIHTTATTYRLADAVDAYRALQAGTVAGRAVITPNG